MEIKEVLLLWFVNFDKKPSGSGIKSMSNPKLADELHKLIIKKIKRRKVYSAYLGS